MKKGKKGVTLIEVLVAMGILAIGLGVALQTLFSVFSIQLKSQKRVTGIQLARTMLERAIYDVDMYQWEWDSGNNRHRIYRPNSDGTRTEVNHFNSTVDPYTTNPPYNTTYTPVPANFPETGDNYSSYYYKVESRILSDPNFLFLDGVARRVSIYILLPPLDPTVDGWGKYELGQDDTYYETMAIRDGLIVVLSTLKTRRGMQTRLTQPAGCGNTILFVEDNSIFAAYTKGIDDGIPAPDLDYTSSYTDSQGIARADRRDPGDQSNYTAVICPAETLDWSNTAELPNFNPNTADRYQTIVDPFPNPPDDHYWEKIQVVGADIDSVSGRQIIRIDNIRDDAASWGTGIAPINGLCFKYPAGRIIKSYINLYIAP
ncbi:MAG: prepilin-type N-terminal cleavage/methylation domain-containing protein [Candidatus Eremiobacteraeota bacterium]|nr:prepilin-type N-terminal cleavage/methylation domain-containing protein [Candidatus Eremiobacteraeota bacterium]